MKKPSVKQFIISEYHSLPICKKCGKRIINGHDWNCPDNPQAKSDDNISNSGKVILGYLVPKEGKF